MENTNFDLQEKGGKREFVFFLPVILIGIAAIFPAFFSGIPTGADFDNHFRFVIPFYEEISKGNFFPAWLGESNSGFGDPRFRFYPPLLYYVLSAFRFFTGEWYWAALLTFTLFSVIGTAGVYLWTRQNLSDQTAIFAALVFAFAPYHLMQFYQASLLAEFAAIAFLPFAFMFVERLLTGRVFAENIFNATGLAIFYALIVMTHIPTTVITTLSLGLYALLLTGWKNNKKGLVWCAGGILFGLLLSSWFWLKMLSELSFIQAGTTVSSAHYDYRNNFIFSPFAFVNLNNWYAGWLFALTFGIFLPVLLILGQLLKRKPDNLTAKYFSSALEITKKRLVAALILAFLTFLMMTDLSRPVWFIIPKLKDIQFPFRWLTIVSLMICPLVALSIQVWRERLKQKNLRPVQFVLLLGFAVSVFFTVTDLIIYSDFITRETFYRRIEQIRGARSFNDWLPRGASEVKDLLPLEGNASAGKRAVVINDWQAQRRNLSIAAGEETQIRVRSYQYPLWQAFQLKDGQKIPLTTDQAEDGTLLIAIPPEAAEIELVIVETSLVKITLIISAIGWLTALGLLVGARKAMSASLRK